MGHIFLLAFVLTVQIDNAFVLTVQMDNAFVLTVQIDNDFTSTTAKLTRERHPIEPPGRAWAKS